MSFKQIRWRREGIRFPRGFPFSPPTHNLGFQFADVTAKRALISQPTTGRLRRQASPPKLWGFGCASLFDATLASHSHREHPWTGRPQKRQRSPIKLFSQQSQRLLTTDGHHRRGSDVDSYGMGRRGADTKTEGFPTFHILRRPEPLSTHTAKASSPTSRQKRRTPQQTGLKPLALWFDYDSARRSAIFFVCNTFLVPTPRCLLTLMEKINHLLHPEASRGRHCGFFTKWCDGTYEDVTSPSGIRHQLHILGFAMRDF